jgi:hypothetical protein
MRLFTSEQIISISNSNQLLFGIPEKNFPVEYGFHPTIIGKDLNAFSFNKSYCIANSPYTSITSLIYRIAKGRLITYYRKSIGTNSDPDKVLDRDYPGKISLNSYRKSNKSFSRTSLLYLDVDNTDPNKPKTKLQDVIDNDDNFLFIYTTPSHTEESPRFRVVYLLDEEIGDAEQLKSVLSYLTSKYNCDMSCIGPDRAFYGNSRGQFYLPDTIRTIQLDVLQAQAENHSSDQSYKDNGHRRESTRASPKGSIHAQFVTVDKNNFTKVLNHCNLLLNLADRTKVSHDDWVLEASNLCRIKKDVGYQEMSRLISPRWNGNLARFDQTWNYLQKSYPHPTGCVKCAYSETCTLRRANPDYKNLMEMISSRKALRLPGCICHLSNHQLRQLESRKIDAGTAFDMVREKIQEAVLDPNTAGRITLIRAGTGIGKTKALLDLAYTGLYAFKTHALSNEFSIGASYPIPNSDFPEYYSIEMCHQFGLSSSTFIQGIIEQYPDHPAVLQYQDQYRTFIEDKIQKITHARLLLNKIFPISLDKTIFIDEDILFTGLSCGTISTELYGHIKMLFPKDIRKRLNQEDVNIKPFSKTPFSRRTLYQIINYIRNNQNKPISGIGEFLKFINSTYCTRSEDQRFFHSVTSHLDRLKKLLSQGNRIIILSATAIPELYEMVFGHDQLNVIDIPPAKEIGKIKVYKPRKNITKTNLQKPESSQTIFSLLNQVNSFESPPIQNVITYGSLNEIFNHQEFYQMVDYFHNTEGTNTHAGKDLIILGTPRFSEEVYLLFGKALGISFNPIDELNDSDKHQINGPEYSITFRSFQNKYLSKLQLSLIHNELLQAIGRARICRFPNRVIVLSNIPIPGFELNYI